MSGLFITFEGTEGSGKTTQIAMTAERLRIGGRDPILLREPGSTPLGEQLRQIIKNPANSNMSPEAELLLMNASRAQLVREKIQPGLQNGRVVLCDRFADSTVAYQCFGRGLPAAKADQIIQFATGGLKPDLTILLLLPPSASEARQRVRFEQTGAGRDRIEGAGRDFFERVAQGYLHLAHTDPDRVKMIDASGTIEAVQARIWEEIETALAALDRGGGTESHHQPVRPPEAS